MRSRQITFTRPRVLCAPCARVLCARLVRASCRAARLARRRALRTGCPLTPRFVSPSLARIMAAKKESAPLRGAKLIKKAIESAKASGLIAAPEPIPSGLVRKLKLPNGESLSPALKELLAFDGEWLGIGYDDEEAEVEGMSLEEVVEEHFGEEGVTAFGEAIEMLSEDCVFFAAELERPACLYLGTADDVGEYPVLSLSFQDGVASIGGFVP